MAKRQTESVAVEPLPSDRAWFDPTLVGLNLYTRITDVTFAGAAVLPAAVLDHTRWAIGFIPGTVSPTTPRCIPWVDVAVSPGWSVGSDDVRWFHLTKFGPLVLDPWYVSAGGSGIIRVIEVIRKTTGK